MDDCCHGDQKYRTTRLAIFSAIIEPNAVCNGVALHVQVGMRRQQLDRLNPGGSNGRVLLLAEGGGARRYVWMFRNVQKIFERRQGVLELLESVLNERLQARYIEYKAIATDRTRYAAMLTDRENVRLARIVRNRRIVHDGAAVTVGDELEIGRLIGAVELQSCGLVAVVDRQQALGRIVSSRQRSGSCNRFP